MKEVVIMRKYDSMLAGMLIGLGGYANFIVGNVVGAVLFSVGLLSVIRFQLPLYTGMVSNKGNYDDIINMFQTLFWNFVGADLLAAYIKIFSCSTENFSVIAQTKLDEPIFMVLFDAIICGICVSIAVKYKHEIVTILAVSLFILCGGEHCVADVFYCGLLSNVDFMDLLHILGFISIVILGNTIGGWMFLRVK